MADVQSQIEEAAAARRLLLDQVADKWSIMLLANVCREPLRFNAIKRKLNGVSQKALTQALRRLERNGILERVVVSISPVAVEYRITPLGMTLKEPMMALYEWSIKWADEVEVARAAFDERYS